MEPLRPLLVPFLLPERCFDQFFLRFQLLDGTGETAGSGFGASRGFPGGFEGDLGATFSDVGAAAMMVTGGSADRAPPSWLRARVLSGRRHFCFGRGKTMGAAIFVCGREATLPPSLFWV